MTPRVSLRPVPPEDLDLLARWLGDSRLVAEHDTPTALAPEDLRRRFDETGYDERELTWRMICGDADRPLGLVTLAPATTAGEYEIGFVVAEPEARGRGVARSGVRALLDELFARDDAQVAVAYAHPDNQASVALLEALGFLAAGLAPAHRMVRGRWADFRVFRLTRERLGA